MKKYFLSIVALAGMLFATSCQESLVEPQMEGPTTFTVQLPDGMGTKAFGEASAVKQLLVEVYPQNGESVIYQTVEQGNGRFEVALNLIQDQAYDILFWAQTANGYVVVSGNETDGYSFGSLRSVPMNANFLNNDNGAAFFHAEKGFVPNGTSTTIKLVRPFAQLNLGTTSASLITDAGEYELVSSAITVTGMANSFNVFSGEGFGNAVATYNFNSQPVPNPNDEVLSAANATYEYVSMNYLSVLGNEKALVDIDATIVVKKGAEEKTIKHSFKSVPVQENYRTNIVGNLISSTTDFVVTIEEGFVDENGNQNPDNDYFVVDNVVDAQFAYNSGETHVAINYIVDGGKIEIPSTAAETLYLQLPDVNAKFTVKVPAEVKKLNITVPNTDESNVGLDLIVDAQYSTVEIKDSQLNTINGTTAQNTLILNGVTVEKVVVTQGNVVVENDSVVEEIAPEEGVDASTITIYVDETIEDEITIDNSFNVEEEEEGDIKFITSAAKLQQLAKSVNGGNNFAGQTITLLADIDLNNVEWTSIGTEDNYFAGTFEGNEHTIKNLTVVETEAKEGKAFIGFFGYAKNATIQKLTFENVYLNIACLDIDHSQGHIGAVAGSLEGTSTIKNVIVKGDIKVEATVTANGASRVAVVAGGNSHGDVTMEEVHVIANEGSYLKANNNVGALAGQLQGKAVFENCSSNIDVTGTKFFAGGLIGIAAGDHTFTNCHTTGDVTITAGREGSANDQYRVGGIAGGWADGKTKVCTLTGCTYTGTVSGTNADGSVAEPLDYDGYVGRGYTLANCAGSKVIIDGVEYVQASNSVYGIYIVNGIYEIATPAALKWLADEVNSGRNYFEGKDVKLVNDIDLNYEEWIPIGSATKDHGFMGNFDGNGKTIKNLKITELKPDTDGYVYAGLFGVTEGTETEENYIKDLVIENVTISTTGDIVSAAIAYPYYTTVENITVKGNISIKGRDYTAGVLAYTRRCVNVSNIAIEGNTDFSSSIEGRITVGGVISDIQMNGGLTAKYTNFSAKGLTIKASHNVGGISGIISLQELNGAEVENVNIVCDDARRGIVSGSLGGTSTIKNVSYENVKGATNIVGAPYDNVGDVVEKDGVWSIRTYVPVETAEELVAALEAGKNVVFKNDITIAATDGGYSKAGILQDKAQAINGAGYTLTVTGAGATWDCAIYTNGGIIKNLTVAGAMRGIFTAGQSSDLYIDNVVFKNVIYTFNSDGTMPANPFGVYVSKSTINGWTSHSDMHTEVVYTNCSFGEGNGYKFCRPYGKTAFVECTFSAGYTIDESKTKDITFTDCTWEE